MVLGTATDAAVIDLVNAWLGADGATGLGIIHGALAAGADARQFCRQVVAYLRQLLLLQAAGVDLAFEGTAEQKAEMLAQAQRAPRQALIGAIKRFNEAATTATSGWQPQLPLELAFIELLPDRPVAQVIKPAPSPVIGEAPAAEPVGPPVAPETPAASRTMDTGSTDATATDTTAAPAVRLTIDLVTTHWREMVAQAGQRNKNLPALLNMGRPLATEGDVVVLGFEYHIFKEKFDNTPGAAQIIGEVFSRLLGVYCTIRCVVIGDYIVPIGKEEFHALAQELGGVVRENQE
jgi:DNA polymerase-3 subunit gamma/tau